MDRETLFQNEWSYLHAVAKRDTEKFYYTNGKKKSKGSLASIVGGTLNPGLAGADTSIKLTELVTDSRPLALVRKA